MALDDYNRKRKFNQTPEPPGEIATGNGLLRFVVQMHEASRLHYDFRIEADGVLKSWAVPKGPSLNPQDQRLAVHVEDHPIAYGVFEGIIPKGNYGAGTVMVWDEGTYIERHSTGREDSEKQILLGIEKGHITFILHGHKLQGEFALIRLKDRDEKSWLLIKKRDSYSSYRDVIREDHSVKTGRTIQEIARVASDHGEIWLPARTLEAEPQHRTHKKNEPLPPPSLPIIDVPEPKMEKIPRRNKPMIPTSFPKPFDQEGWLFEIDYDGYRTIAETEKTSAHIYSKQLLSFDKKFPKIIEALRELHLTAVLDGEIEISSDNSEEQAIYWVRDLLHLDGWNLRQLPLIERKKRLESLNIFNKTIRYCPHVLKEGRTFFNHVTQSGQNGVLARDIYSTYTPGTTKKWLRIPAATEQPVLNSPRLTHLDKVYWPAEKITKGDLIEYYKSIAPFLLPHLKDRPESLHRHPDGIQTVGFFHKDMVGHHPRWVSTCRIYSESVGKSIDYLVCQNEATLLYMANLGCIELNPWLSRVDSLDRPDAAVIDIDPDENDFSEVIEITTAIHEVLSEIGTTHLCKTSGATGMHIFIPLQAKYDYEQARSFTEAVCKVVHQRFPKQTSLERSPSKRQGKIYLDCLQNVKGQTVASVYCVRPRPGAPVSTPLQWSELSSSLRPESFTIHNVPERLKQLGDLWEPLLHQSVDLETCLLSLARKFPM